MDNKVQTQNPMENQECRIYDAMAKLAQFDIKTLQLAEIHVDNTLAAAIKRT